MPPRPKHVLSEDNPPFQELVDTLGEADRINIIVGAGASIDAGLPSWYGLLQTTLEDGFQTLLSQTDYRKHAASVVPDGLANEITPYEYLAEQTLEVGDLRNVATIARLLHGKRSDESIRDALYRGTDFDPAPGRVCHSIARLAYHFPGGVRIITTNYDDLLERALEDSRPDKSFEVRSWIPGSRLRPRERRMMVEHIHGFLPPEADENEARPLLDEQDYSLLGPAAIDKLTEALEEEHPTVLVGFSLSDPNLLAALHRADRSATCHGLFVQSQEPRTYPDLVVTAQSKRLIEMGITPVDLKSYGQVAQVLIEARLRRLVGKDYWSEHRYGLRLETWRSRFSQRYPTPDPNRKISGKALESFHDWQSDIHDRLVEALGDVPVKTTREEHLGIEVWARRPGEDLGAVDLIASSSRQFSEPWLVEGSYGGTSCPVSPKGKHPAAQAIYYGTTQKQHRSGSDRTRWESVVAVPIFATEEPDLDIPVGVLALVSTRAWEESALQDILGQQMRRTEDDGEAKLRDFLHGLGHELLVDHVTP